MCVGGGGGESEMVADSIHVYREGEERKGV